jgi:SAM-dependent methyltransferase
MPAPYRADLAHIHAAAFSEFARRAAAAIVPMFERDATPVRRVLDIGCGPGVTTQLLAAHGFEVTALEPSAAMLALARQAIPTATFLEGTAYRPHLPRADAILAIGEALSYHLPGDDADGRLQTFFKAACAALPPGGQLLFDLIVAEGPSLEARGYCSGEDWAIGYATNEDRAEHTLTRTIETFRLEASGLWRRDHEVHHVRVFEGALLERWLGAAGFAVETAAGYGEVHLPPRRLAFVAKRR